MVLLQPETASAAGPKLHHHPTRPSGKSDLKDAQFQDYQGTTSLPFLGAYLATGRIGAPPTGHWTSPPLPWGMPTQFLQTPLALE